MSTTTAREFDQSPEYIARRRLAIHRHSTAYDLAIVRGDERYRICYAALAKGRRPLWDCITSNGRAPMLVALTGTEEITFAKKAADGGTMGEWKIVWTGRTEIQALTEGELPHFTDAVCLI